MASLYVEAARVLETLDNKKGTVKSLCLSNKVVQNKKQLYALVCETLKYRKVIQQILQSIKLLSQEKNLTQTLAQLLVYDFLFGRGINNAPKKAKESVLKHKSALQSELARLKIKAKVTRNQDLLTDDLKNEVELPRYVRVNTLKTTVEDVVQHFNREGYTHVSSKNFSYVRFISMVENLKPKQFATDLHIPELLVFAPKTDLHDHILYNSGDIILQDKASCLPAHVLSPPAGSHVIDCCAAPGNKTTHAASFLSNSGKIFSFDLDAKRLATMATLTLKASVLCAELINMDFLKVNPEDAKYAKVTHAIVDPSCSGSGIVSRLNNLTDDAGSTSMSRLRKLAAFQRSILTHALSFPNIQRVVYSTCSVHRQENEEVVESTLRHLNGRFIVVDPGLEGLTGRGSGGFPGHEHCVRMDPTKDLTNGFFVTCFERVKEGEKIPEWFSKPDNEDEGSESDTETQQSKSGFQANSQEIQREKDVGSSEAASTNQETERTKNTNSDLSGVSESSGKKKKRKKKKKSKAEKKQSINNDNFQIVKDDMISAGSKRVADSDEPEAVPLKKAKITEKHPNHSGNVTKKKKQKRKKKHTPVTA